MSEQNPKMTVYSDYVCPFCYLGRRSLEDYQAQREEPLSIDWRPFDLRRQKRGPDGEIDHSVDDGKDDEYYEQAARNVERLQEEYGADEMLDMDETPDEVDSYDAQVASVAVRDAHPDSWLAFDEAVFDALWVEGRDIGDHDVLVDVAESVGLDGSWLREVITDGEYREAVESAFQEAGARGITGVPTFVYDGHAARGAVPPEHLARLVEGRD